MSAMETQAPFSIEVDNLHWLADNAAEDLCAHGSVEVRIGDQLVMQHSDGAGWSVSAAALLLLRSLSLDHRPDAPLNENLVPCCGTALTLHEGPQDPHITGCPFGFNWWVRHFGDRVRLETVEGVCVECSIEQWRDAVFRFADTVKAFYEGCVPKVFCLDFEEPGYWALHREWDRRRQEVAGPGGEGPGANP